MVTQLHPNIAVSRWVSRAARSLSVAFCLAAIPSIALGSNPTFTQTCFSNNLTPALAAGDFNHDGRLDVAINPGSQDFPFFLVYPTIDVYLGNGDGTFSGPTELDSGSPYLDMAAADLNNDGNLDLVTSQFVVFLGNGNGTFQARQTNDGGSSSGIAVGDFDRNGVADLATGTPNKKSMSVVLGKGDGTFNPAITYRTADYNKVVISGDFNGDGLIDLVGLNGGNHNGVSVLLGKGDGKFREHVPTVLPGFGGRGLAAADFDADGKLDLVVPVQDGGGVLVLGGHGDGSFGAPSSYPMPGNALHVSTGDLNSDGKQDIVAGNYVANYPNPGGSVTILYGNGAGGFASGGATPVAYGFMVLVANVNADARPDIFADSCVLLNNGSVAAGASARSGPVGPSEEARVSAAFASPNPLRDEARLGFTTSKAGPVSIRLFDLSGRLVRRLQDQRWIEAGPHELRFDRNGLPPGIYLYRIESGTTAASGRVVVMD